MTAPLVDYDEYRKAYTGYRFGSLPGNKLGYAKRFAAPMGAFKQGLLTPAGVRVRKLLMEFAGGRAPKHSGVARGRVYFKWEVTADWDRAPFLIATDALLDEGYESEVVEQVAARTGQHYVKIVIRW